MSRRKNKKEQSIYQLLISAIVIICLAVSGYYGTQKVEENKNTESNIVKTEVETTSALFDLSTIPEYQGNPYIEINNNIPYFKEEDYTTESFERYSEWDELGRSGMAFANICKEVMPPEGEERGEIGMIKDLSGWVQKRYDNLIKDKYLYNRCHLIGFQLTGENANPKNLITCTRFMNTKGMLEFENKVANYIKETKNHVLYRVTPIYEGDNLLASGVVMEAYSVEDRGEGIKFNVFVYNIQTGIEIDYKTGESKLK